ncbi:CPW-WPC family protein [Plasmodium ovale wallikeri]|uniref:CPW-WPC family protein n=1 Tax=Plasmodium ovale wallikeri TaxID=864142 RepID=A0A1A9A1L5_PLAOA|nr:CPW-WPC family protein [Plasmodium ovale wallikeri]SBT50041.1 CPW-WPC family protein [Plasmodium ovale wallikeri]
MPSRRERSPPPLWVLIGTFFACIFVVSPLSIVLPLHIATSYCRFTLPPPPTPVVVSQMPSPRCMSLILTVFLISVAVFKDDHLFTCALSTGKGKHGSSLSVSGESDLFDDVSAFTEELTKSFSHTLRKVPIAGMIKKTEMIVLREMGANARLSNFSPRTSISGPPPLKERVKFQMVKASESLDLPNPEEEMCEINYSEMCPEGWVNLGDGVHCISPVHYNGPCEKKVSFKNATPRSKYNFSTRCNVSWPCMGNCIEDFSKECPQNWTLRKGTCYAPKRYKGICVRKKNFTHFSEAEKKIWGNICGVNWPCYDKDYNFSLLCPLKWKVQPDGKTCVAPDLYTGPCNHILYLFHIKDEEKLFLKKICNIEWPIRKKKEYNFNDTCPIGWKFSHEKNGTCIAPSSYEGPCEKTISFDIFSHEEKYIFSQKCDVHWPMLTEKIQNYDLPCPHDWVELKESNKHDEDNSQDLCVSPSRYDGPCEHIFSFKNYTKEMKAAWASVCNAYFTNDNILNFSGLHNEKKNIWGKSKKIYSYKGNGGETQSPSVSNGPIGHSGSSYAGIVLNADDETVYLPNGKKDKKNFFLMNDIGDSNNAQFILSDDKIRDLLLLKGSSVDDVLRSNIDETIHELRKSYAKQTSFPFTSFLQAERERVRKRFNRPKNRSSAKSSGTHPVDIIFDEREEVLAETKEKPVVRGKNDTTVEREEDKNAYADNLRETKNLYRSYIVEMANFPYEDICLEKDYTKCPLGWTKINNKECLAPQSYVNNLRKCKSILNIFDFVKNMYDVAHDISFVTIDEDGRKKMEKECDLHFPCIECERDYVRVNCPLGWTQTNDGNCKSPADYPVYLRELCGDVVNFKYATPNFRRNWSFVCKSDWPCFSPCEKNYGAACPVGYKLINERVLEGGRSMGRDHIQVCLNENWKERAPRDSFAKRNTCHIIEIYNSLALKKEIERKCKVIWPCINKCEENFYQTCPYNWLLKKNRCIAPYYYNPPKGCSKSFDVLTFNAFDKFLFSNKCFAPWPCKDSCQQDWTAPCPDEWVLTKRKKGFTRTDTHTDTHTDTRREHLCKPSHKYKGACNNEELHNLSNFTFLQKQDFSYQCGVKWPCGGILHNTQNWQNENVYNDTAFANRKTTRFYDPYYASHHAMQANSFF